MGFTDEELKAFIKQHKGTVHTREFPSRCGMCRLFDRLEATEAVVEWARCLHFGNDCTCVLMDNHDKDCQEMARDKKQEQVISVWRKSKGGRS